MSQDHSHLITEQLSAFLDQQLTTEEQQQAKTHLQDCEQCRLRLADLQQMVALLHALPRPQAPRSFTLQTTDAPATPLTVLPTERSADTAPRSTATRRTGWSRAVRTATRVISTLAAVIGIFFLIASLLAPVHYYGATGTAVSSNNTAGQTQNSAHSTSQGKTNDQAKTKTPYSLTPATAPTMTPTPTAAASSPDTSVTNPPATINLSQPGTQALLGLALLILSIIGFILLRIQRPRAP